MLEVTGPVMSSLAKFNTEFTVQYYTVANPNPVPSVAGVETEEHSGNPADFFFSRDKCELTLQLF